VFVKVLAGFLFYLVLVIGGFCIPVKQAAAEEQPVPPSPSERPAEESPSGPWSAMVYAGFGTASNLGEVLTFDIDSEDSHFIGGVLNRQMFRFWDYFIFELEGQTIRHFGKQDHWEFNGLFLVRFDDFPWDRIVDTSFSVGDGLSYATEVPIIEEENHTNNGSTELLNYLMFEIAFTAPSYPEWSLVARVHHRSGVFGLFDGVHGGSNFLALGLRHKF
jgi:hypothetical protein